MDTEENPLRPDQAPPVSGKPLLPLLRDLEERRHELRLVASRLGTSDEKEGDVEYARDLAHTISNLSTAVELRSNLEALGAEPVNRDITASGRRPLD